MTLEAIFPPGHHEIRSLSAASWQSEAQGLVRLTIADADNTPL
jgi:hypothetical protein